MDAGKVLRSFLLGIAAAVCIHRPHVARSHTEEEKRMVGPRSTPAPRAATVAGLVVGAMGIAILWASGVAFPFIIPPGLVILLAGACFVGLSSRLWAPAVGAFMGVFVTVGFVISGSVPNLVSGEDGAGVLVGTWVQLVGVLTALVAGVIATRANYRAPTEG